MGVGRGFLVSHQCRLSRIKGILLFTLVTTLSICFLFSTIQVSSGPTNYFLDAEDYSQLTYIVDTPTCHILNISAWHKSILPFLTNVSSVRRDCQKNRKWTYINNQQKLIINKSAVCDAGFSFNSIHCCYKSFRRKKSSPAGDLNADSVIEFSPECKSLADEETELSEGEEFIRVLCTSKYWPWSMDVIYRYFHAIPLVSKKLKEKARRWQKTGPMAPPNVLLLGIDSMSRLSFQRNMGKTRNTLIELGAHEMLGYTKLGENTFPNAAAFMMGFHEQDLPLVCNFSLSTYIDSCPFIWKNFSSQDYITSFIEDAPYLATYNYAKLGFKQQPVDFYLRPFMLGVNQYTPRKTYYYLDCIGSQTVDEMILEYIGNIINISSKLKTPSFIYTWLTNLAHGDINAAQTADYAYDHFLRSLDLSNTIFFFMSDHGYRYGEVRQTFAGWYEDKLPNFWVYLPPHIKKSFPSWENSLITNTKRLASPLDLHETLQHILQTFSHQPKQRPAMQKLTRQSLFQEIPQTRNCSDAGIPNYLCACSVPKKLEVDDLNIVKASHVALNDLNARLPKQCDILTIVKIHAGGVLYTEEKSKSVARYVVAFYTEPGGFLFEGNVEVSTNGEWKSVGELLRMNKINTDVSCVTAQWEKFCHC